MIRPWFGLLLGLLAGGCTKPAMSEQELAVVQAQAVALADELATDATADMGGVVVRLAFGPEADLDLYVTDPLLDTVYFARHETRTGGVLDSDIRCDSPGPRVEEVHFDNLWPGKYRVGVDFPQRCDGLGPPAPAAYAVIVNANGKTYSANGIVNLKYFEVVVLEFEVKEGGS